VLVGAAQSGDDPGGPRGQVLAEAPAGTAETLELSIDLADTRDTYLRQQRDDVVSVTWHA
jgi:hypothetical protein